MQLLQHAYCATPCSPLRCQHLAVPVPRPIKRFRSIAALQHQSRNTRCHYKVQDGIEGENTVQAAVPLEHQVYEIMNSEPLILEENMPIREAIAQMLEGNVSSAPVVDSNGALVGMLSESDLLWKGVGHPHDHFIIPPVFLGFADALIYLRDTPKYQAEVAKLLAHTVGQAMTREQLVCVAPGCSLPEAAEIMLEKKVTRLPVVDSAGDVVGLLSRQDIMRALLRFNNPYL